MVYLLARVFPSGVYRTGSRLSGPASATSTYGSSGSVSLFIDSKLMYRRAT